MLPECRTDARLVNFQNKKEGNINATTASRPRLFLILRSASDEVDYLYPIFLIFIYLLI